MQHAALQMNLHLLPKDTFIFDELPVLELERTLDRVHFYNEVDVGLTLEEFNTLKRLKPFVPVATFDSNETKSRHQEFVSVIEGTYMPFFGVTSRLDKI